MGGGGSTRRKVFSPNIDFPGQVSKYAVLKLFLLGDLPLLLFKINFVG